MMKHALIGLTLLATMLACGGGGGGGSSSGSSTPTLEFTTTATDNEYRFVKDTALSTDTRLVLDLLGPTGVSTRGVAVFLSADTGKVIWVNPATGGTNGSLIEVGTQFDAGSSPAFTADKFSDKILQAGVFQKGGTAATYDGKPILSVALALKSTAAAGTVTFGAVGTRSITLSGDNPGVVRTITIDTGTVSVE
jgi:hypothetical protein